ncbi:hypothetical protein [Alkalihalobacterium elongatum]|uniref:hypothetical protein n=1 Tax=Alkalihalobacterium elongatum TaxID=2675466 RepID=UPI001C1F23E6|nr:hypothetical protein [Alkalihalobacterium elongatum]
MKNISKLFTVYILFCMIFFLIVHFGLSIQNDILIYLILLLPIFWLCKHVNDILKEKEKVEIEKIKLEKEKHFIQQENEHLNDLLNGFNEIFFFVQFKRKRIVYYKRN